MSKVSKEILKIFKPMHKVIFKKFICHVEGVEGSVHMY